MVAPRPLWHGNSTGLGVPAGLRAARDQEAASAWFGICLWRCRGATPGEVLDMLADLGRPALGAQSIDISLLG